MTTPARAQQRSCARLATASVALTEVALDVAEASTPPLTVNPPNRPRSFASASVGDEEPEPW